MLKEWKEKPQKIICIGDAFVSPASMEEAVRNSEINVDTVTTCFWGTDDKQAYTKAQLNVERNGPTAEPYPEELDNLIAGADILFTHFSPVPEKLLAKAPKLKGVITCRGGLEHIDVAYASTKNIPVVNVIRNAEPVADFALGMIIGLTRNIATSHHGLMTGKWLKTFPNSAFTTTLSQLTVGMAGLGNIGIELAIRLKALGIPTIAHDPYTTKERLKKNGLTSIEMVDTMEEVFQRSDVVSLHLRLVESNAKIIDRKYFSLMKPTAYFINTARGGLVNQPDLVKALTEKQIAGAALDVFDTEPLKPDDPLLQLDNVLLTPHIAGTTVDAIPKAPFMLMKEVDKILTLGITDRIVNYNQIKL